MDRNFIVQISFVPSITLGSNTTLTTWTVYLSNLSDPPQKHRRRLCLPVIHPSPKMTTDPLPPPAELWRHPDPASTQMHKFLERVKAKYQLDIDDYPGLYKWSVENVADFWSEVWHFCGIKASRPYREVRRTNSLISPLRQSAAISRLSQIARRQPRAASPPIEIGMSPNALLEVACPFQTMAFPHLRELRGR